MSCTSHRTLSLIIGWLNVTLPLLSIISLLISWLVFDLPKTKGEAKPYGTVLLALVITYLVLWFILSALLIKGILENRHKLMAPWVYMTGFIVFALTFLMVYDIIAGLVMGWSFILLLMEFIGNCLVLGIIIMVMYPVLMLFLKIRSMYEYPEEHGLK